jgi:hypothetical protein
MFHVEKLAGNMGQTTAKTAVPHNDDAEIRTLKQGS